MSKLLFCHLFEVFTVISQNSPLCTHLNTPFMNFQDAFKLHRMDIRLGRLKMPIENSLGYYELPPGDFSDNIQPPSSVPIEKPLTSHTGNDCQPEQSESFDKHEDETR